VMCNRAHHRSSGFRGSRGTGEMTKSFLIGRPSLLASSGEIRRSPGVFKRCSCCCWLDACCSGVAVRSTSAAAGSAVLKQSGSSLVSRTHPIAPSVGRTTTRCPGSIWATMVSGVLADKSIQRAAQAAPFYARRFPCSTNGLNRLKAVRPCRSIMIPEPRPRCDADCNWIVGEGHALSDPRLQDCRCHLAARADRGRFDLPINGGSKLRPLSRSPSPPEAKGLTARCSITWSVFYPGGMA